MPVRTVFPGRLPFGLSSKDLASILRHARPVQLPQTCSDWWSTRAPMVPGSRPYGVGNDTIYRGIGGG